MVVKDQVRPSRLALTGAQRALLDERLQRAAQATAKPAGASPSIPRRETRDDTPLSFAQERLWFLDQLEPGSAVYNLFQAVRLRGALDLAVLERALNEIVRRHEILRTNFVASEGHAVQVIADERKLAVALVDVGGRVNGAGEAEAQKRLREESRRPFDLERDLLLRALVVRHGPAEHTLMLTMHHIISDGWSVGILFREIAAIYGGLIANRPATLPELPVQYADYVRWERAQFEGASLDRSLAYWRKQLEGTLPALQLPTDRPRSATPTSRGAAHTMQFPMALTQRLKAVGQAEGATLFMTLLAAFQVLLYRWTGQEDIVVGSVVAGRRKAELEKLIGFFVNTLVLRGDLTGNPTFRDLLARTREMSLGALAHQDLPFERLVRELRPDRSISRNPLFQVMFVLQTAPMAPTNLPELSFEPLDVDNGTAKFDLTLSMLETPHGLQAGLEYNADLFEPETVTRLMGCFETLLASIGAQPEERIARLPLLTPAQQRQLVVEFNETRVEYPRDATIAELFEAQVTRTPAAVAVIFQEQRLTYQELDRRANGLAHRLRRAGVGPDVLVGVCAERSLELIVALVAILKAGGAYVALDPEYPKERLAFMLGDARPRVLLTRRGLRSDLFPAHDAEVICLDDAEHGQDARATLEHGQDARATAEHLAYVSYTSGSTGQPKGVAVPHRGVVRLVKNSGFVSIETTDVFLQFAPIAFDASTFEIWGALLNGASLLVMPPGHTTLSDLGETIEGGGVTTLWLTAGLFNQMIDEQSHRLRNVRQLVAGGDTLSVRHVARALEKLPRTQLINGYGPTENTTFTCCHRIAASPRDGRSVSIGRPIANTQVFILDAQRQLVPMGVPGELYAGGDGLARGYLNRPDLTSEKFVTHPFCAEPGARLYRTGDLARWLPDGSIDFLGRGDRQVKIRGFRVEPAEVEAVLATHPAVKECAVVPRELAPGEKSLAAYIVPRQMPMLRAAEWRKFLEAKIPDHAVPSTFVSVGKLPLSSNGKIDLAALPAPDGSRPELASDFIAPRDPVEHQLAEIWQEVLGVEPIGIHDRFFDLGGHSLLAVRMVAQLERKFGKKLPLAAVFQHRTIEHLARLLRPNAPGYTSGTSIVEIQGHGHRPPVYLVHGVGGGMFWGYANLARHLGGNQPLYAFKSRGLDGLKEHPTIEEIAANYLADLRVRQPRGPYRLGGYCFGGVVAYEMAQQLRAVGEEVELLALMNCSPPNGNYGRVDNRRSLAWQAKFVGNIAYWLGCFLFRWTGRERAEFLRWKMRLLRKKTVSAPGQNGGELAMTDVDEMVNLAAYSEEQRRLWQTHVQALKNYRPQPYAGSVTLFRTRGHALLSSFDEHYGWGDLVRGGIALKVMPGGHGSILDEPHVRAVAREFTRCVSELPGASKEAGA
ncbi:MAG: amino acid adenylation domain-containing protein [Opitutaceae bacterium]